MGFISIIDGVMKSQHRETFLFKLKSLSQGNHFVKVPVEVYISKDNLAFSSLIKRSFSSIEQITFQRTILQHPNSLINEIDNI